MRLHVVVEGDLVVQGRIDPSRKQQFKRLVEVVNASDAGTVTFGDCRVSARDGIGGALSGKILKAVDVGVVARNDNSYAGISVRVGEVVLRRTFLSNLNAVCHNIIASGFDTGQQAVPFAFDKVCAYADLIRDRFGDLDIKADQFVILIMIGPRRPSTFGSDGDLAFFLDLSKKIVFIRFSVRLGAALGFGSAYRAAFLRRRCSGRAGAASAAGQAERAQKGRCHYDRKKFLFHILYSFLCFSFIAMTSTILLTIRARQDAHG